MVGRALGRIATQWSTHKATFLTTVGTFAVQTVAQVALERQHPQQQPTQPTPATTPSQRR